MRGPSARPAGLHRLTGGLQRPVSLNDRHPYFSENVKPAVNRWTRGVESSRWTKNVR